MLYPQNFIDDLKNRGDNTAVHCRPNSNIDTAKQQTENFIMTATLDIDLPHSVHLTENELKIAFAAKLFEMGELSSGQAAKMVGITRREFLKSVGKYGVSILQYDADELEEDLERLRK